MSRRWSPWRKNKSANNVWTASISLVWVSRQCHLCQSNRNLKWQYHTHWRLIALTKMEIIWRTAAVRRAAVSAATVVFWMTTWIPVRVHVAPMTLSTTILYAWTIHQVNSRQTANVGWFQSLEKSTTTTTSTTKQSQPGKSQNSQNYIPYICHVFASCVLIFCRYR